MTFERTRRILWGTVAGLWVLVIALLIVAAVLWVRSGT